MLMTVFFTTVSGESFNTPDESIIISLERGMCFGTCPVYSIILFGNGTIKWTGEMYVDSIGSRTDHIDGNSVTDLFNSLESAGFFNLNDSFTSYDITDMPTAILTVQNNSVTKQVVHYYGDLSAPEKLPEMEESVDEMANTSRWIGNGSSINQEYENLYI